MIRCVTGRLFQLCCCLAIVLSLLSQSVARAQTRVEEHRKTNSSLRCTIEVQNPVWSPTTPAIVRVKVENLSDGALEVRIRPILHLSSKTSNTERDKYWAPVDLLRDAPLDINRHPVDQKGTAIAIKPIPITLAFNSKAQSFNFSIDAQRVRWDKEISSVWPSRELFATVDAGTYNLRLVLETETDEIASPSVSVQIGEDKPKP